MGTSYGKSARGPIRVMIVSGLLAVLVSAYILYRWSGNRDVEQALEAIRAEGYPVELEELNAWYVRPPAGENAADVLARAIEWYAGIEPELSEHLPVSGQAETPERTEPLPDGMKKIIAHHLERNVDTLEFLHEGAAIPEGRWPVDFLQGFNAELSHLAQIREGARLLMLEAMYKAEHGDNEGATDAVLAAIGVAHSLEKEPILMSQLVRLACLGISRDTLEQTLNRTALTDAQLTRIQQALREAEDTDGFVRGFVGERCMAADLMRHGGPAGAPAPMPGVPMRLYDVVGLNAIDTRVLLDTYKGIIDAARTPLDDRLAGMHAADALYDQIPSYCMISRMIMPAIARAIEADIRTAAQFRAARTALAVERYRLAHGELPESLDDLVPEFLDQVPKDPFGDGPVKYKLLESGFMVYSIGIDEEDDGGKEPGWIERNNKRRREDIREVDLTFTVERTP